MRISRSSLLEVFHKKGAMKNLAKVTGKRLCMSFFFHKVAELNFNNYYKFTKKPF